MRRVAGPALAMTPRAARLSAAAAVAGLLLMGCAGTEDGPLESTDEPGAVVCTPQEPGTGRAVIALSELRVTGDDDVTITSVSLVDAEGLAIVGYDVGDVEDPDFRVVGDDYGSYGPPDARSDPVLEAGASYVLKVGLTAEPSGGRATAAAIDYHVGDSDAVHTTQTRVEMEVAAAGAVCSG